jgi:hypothetical protein
MLCLRRLDVNRYEQTTDVEKGLAAGGRPEEPARGSGQTHGVTQIGQVAVVLLQVNTNGRVVEHCPPRLE